MLLTRKTHLTEKNMRFSWKRPLSLHCKLRCDFLEFVTLQIAHLYHFTRNSYTAENIWLTLDRWLDILWYCNENKTCFWFHSWFLKILPFKRWLSTNWLIMVIELSGVQFGMKSLIRVITKSNERGALVRFEFTSMISDQNCMTWSSIVTLLDPFWNCTM